MNKNAVTIGNGQKPSPADADKPDKPANPDDSEGAEELEPAEEVEDLLL